MQVQLIAFAPFIVLAGTAVIAASISLAVRLRAPVVNIAVLPAPVVVRHSAEIIYFPVMRARQVPAALPWFSASASAK